jgi:branched-chain amino acid transport system substrate-binding protein
VDLAVAECDKAGGLAGLRPIIVLHVDVREGQDPEPPAVRLITVNKVVGLLADLNVAQTDKVAAVAGSYGVPLVTPVGSPGRALGNCVFHTGLAPQAAGRALARFAATDLKARRTAVFVDGNDPKDPDAGLWAAGASAFTREFLKRGGAIAAERSYRTKDELGQLMAAVPPPPPSANLLAGLAADVGGLEAARSPILFAGDEGAVHELASASPPAVVYLATAFAEDDPAPRAREFVARYRQRFGESPDVHAALAYEGTRLMIEAVRQCQSVEAGKVCEALAKIKDFQSLAGPFRWGEDLWAVRTAIILEIDKGRVKEVRRFPPGRQTVHAPAVSLADPVAALYPAEGNWRHTICQLMRHSNEGGPAARLAYQSSEPTKVPSWRK